MALLLLQDCLIDLSNIDNSVSINMSDILVKKILNNTPFDDEDLDEILKTIFNFIEKHNYNTNTIYISSVYFNIPFFEEKIYEKTSLKLNTIFDYLYKNDKSNIHLTEIGRYFKCMSSYDYDKTHITKLKIEKYNIDNEIFNLVKNYVESNDSFTSVESINKLNQGLPKDTFSEFSDTESSQMNTHFKCFKPSTLNVSEYYNLIANFLDNEEGNIITPLSLMNLFKAINIINLENIENLEISNKNKNIFSVELIPCKINFKDGIIFNIWSDRCESSISVKNNDRIGSLELHHRNKQSININLNDLNLYKIYLKVDGLNNLSCKIKDLKKNSSITQKIKFN